MAMTPKTAPSRAAILANLGPEVTRIQVIDEFGKTRFKKPQDLADADQIVLGNSGEPVVMTGKPGRRKKPELKPATETVADLIRLKEAHLGEDDLLGTIRQNPEASSVLDFVMEGLAEEAASLSFERQEAERQGQPTSQISMRRINALKAVGDSWLKRKEQIANNGVDMDSPAFRRLFQFIMDTFREALEAAGTRPEMVETIFTNFSRRLDDDWHREASKRMQEG